MLHELLKTSSSEAYIAVKAEARLVTITIPQDDAAQLAAELTRAGYNVKETSLQGAFHHPAYEDEIEALLNVFDSRDELRFSDLWHTLIPANPQRPHGNALLPSHIATRAILCDTADWSQLYSYLDSSRGSSIITFGRKRCIPNSVIGKIGKRLVHGAEIRRLDVSSHQEDIAIIGMACNVPGGDDVTQFWESLCTGKSMHVEVPADRIRFPGLWRKGDDQRKWFGNFVEHPEAFDHKFFKKTPIEMASTDPQQRLMIQVAYQALENSGYFNVPSPETNVACYVGIGPNDYEGNVANHEPTAYTATGNLRSFAAGKISHFFEWKAPGITIDTACSSSAVAVHEACKAIITGECSTALAGGTNVMTGCEWFQNLAGASFLSLTGQCKPFDAAADGYCRAEGAGAVYLKKLSNAQRDGDQVLGIIKSTFVAQNENCSAITAPTARSLADGFKTVIHRANLTPKDISFVEAHGTGTQVGDKAEYSAIRETFADEARTSPLSLGSVKGHIGHLESASGIASIIKVVLMMHHKVMPPQASHKTINPKILSSPAADNKIRITASRARWTDDVKFAMINNYGASGSNASIVLAQPPPRHTGAKVGKTIEYPFWLCAAHGRSLRAYATKLARFIRARQALGRDASPADISYQLSVQSNRSLETAFTFTSSSPGDLLERLDNLIASQSDDSAEFQRHRQTRPVILVFGGQVSDRVTVNRELYDNIQILRTHLDRCNDVCISLGYGAIVPYIFAAERAKDVIGLQLALFSMQYSAARCWIESGVEVTAVVGHSFGELTAMCIAGTLSLRDAITLVACRASVIHDNRGPDSGSMMFVEASESEVESLLEASKCGAAIACYNGPRSFTLAGTTSEIDALQDYIGISQVRGLSYRGAMLTLQQAHKSLRSKRLSVTNAFHSRLVEPLMANLSGIGERIIWRKPQIHHERATLQETSDQLPKSEFVASHMREPVYFGQAVRRLADKYPTAVWLEAGSASGITGMASKALGTPSEAHFQSVNLSDTQNLATATVNLWRAGLNCHFWAHNRCQASTYTPLMLPSYQFDKHAHWLARETPPETVTVAKPAHTAGKLSLWTFTGYQKSDRGDRSQASFSINTESEEFKTHVCAHVIAQAAPICPTGFQHHIAVDAISSIMSSEKSERRPCELQKMENHAAIVTAPERELILTAWRSDDQSMIWDWNISSTGRTDGKRTLHVTGQVVFIDTHGFDMFSRYGRLVSHAECTTLLNDLSADNIIHGKQNIYKIFSPVVHYNEEAYKGLQKIVCKGTQSAGRVVVPPGSNSLASNVGLSDSFCQVAGIFANCMSDCKDD